MDLAKYIGLFLLKNRFCYIHGLGNLEVKKKPVNYDGKTLQASPYEVIITPAGSIDDTLANFIATNEQISISKAANALRDFSTQARADLQAGKEVPIPYLGKFVEEHNKISFITDPNFQYTPPGIPSIRTVPQPQNQPATAKPDPVTPTTNNPLPAPDFEKYAPKEKSSSSLNWTRIILAIVILLVVAGGTTFVIMMHKGGTQNVNIPIPVVKDDVKSDTAMHVDSAVKPASTTTPATNAAATTPTATGNAEETSYKMIVGVYTDKSKAEKRVNQFTNHLGKKAEMVAKDSATFYVLMPVRCKPEDTTHVEDSLRRFYYPSGKVTIYR